MKFDVLHESKNYIYLNKPAVVTVESIFEQLQVKNKFLIHRLDMNTTGVLAFAKNVKSADHFRIGHHFKEYLCLVQGSFPHEYFNHEFYLYTTKEKVYVKQKNNSKLSHHEIWCLKKTPNFSVLKIQLHTGRRHQIRAGLQSLGFPIIGDRKYGSGKFFYRPAIHAYKLQIEGEDLVCAPLENKLESALESFCEFKII